MNQISNHPQQKMSIRRLDIRAIVVIRFLRREGTGFLKGAEACSAFLNSP